jgi:hypothetical protein
MRNSGKPEDPLSAAPGDRRLGGNPEIHPWRRRKMQEPGQLGASSPGQPKERGFGVPRRLTLGTVGRCRMRGNSEPHLKPERDDAWSKQPASLPHKGARGPGLWRLRFFSVSMKRNASSLPAEPLLEHSSFNYELPCPIHSAFFCGMGGIPTKLRSTQFPKNL